MKETSNWNKLKNNFKNILKNNNTFFKIFNEITNTSNNTLVYSTHGFPLDLFVDEIIKNRFNIETIYKKNSQWKTISYVENQYFFEINFMNPDIRKDLSSLTEFILHLIQSHNLSHFKKIIVLKHIEYLTEFFFQFRILLEKYSSNVVFMCTSHSISKIEAPIKSRFNIFRIPLFSYNDICDIFKNYIDNSVPEYLSSNISCRMKSRDYPGQHQYLTMGRWTHMMEQLRTAEYSCHR